MNENSKVEASHYGISAVARLTGITVHTLRVWESRYAAIKANRTESGHRHYSRKDVERLQLLKFLVDRGSSISKVAKLDETELKNRVAELERGPSVVPIDSKMHKPRVAVYGTYLPLKFEGDTGNSDALDMIFSSSDMDQFKADIRRLKPDVLILEFSIVDPNTSALVAELQRLSGARRIVVIYSYSRDIDIHRLSDDVVSTFRAPVTIRELTKLLSAGGPLEIRTQISQVSPAEEEQFIDDIPARMFSQPTLARLANTSTSIDCECPHHLVGLVVNLSHFEDYSASCSNRNEDDAALHSYLQLTAAKARSMMEEALERVAVAEGLLPNR